jgi:hypothetical protein
MNLNSPQDNLAQQLVSLKTRVAHLESLEQASVNAGLWIPIQGIQNISGAPAAIQWTAIDQSYERLRIMFYLQSTRAALADTLRTRFNADAGNNYSYNTQNIAGGPTAGVGVNGILWGTLAGATPTIFSSGYIDIYDYTSTTEDKPVISLFNSRLSAGSTWASGMWSPGAIAAITQIDLDPTVGGTFSINSWAQLYGFLKPS